MVCLGYLSLKIKMENKKMKNKKELVNDVIWLLKWLNDNNMKSFKNSVQVLHDEMQKVRE